jgi:hypothetical protein
MVELEGKFWVNVEMYALKIASPNLRGNSGEKKIIFYFFF